MTSSRTGVETYEILSTGKLFQPNPLIPIIARYPGLHAATAALVHATGLTIWQAATLLLILFHVTLVLGIAALAQALGFNNRTASLIAILYALNSSFLYFDTQYAYESMAITLVVWTLVAYVRAIRSQSGQGRAAWSVLTVVLSAGTVITHHLSTFTLVLIMALVSLAVSVPWLARAEGWVRTAVTAWGLTLVTTLMAGAWFHFVAPDTWSYLSPYLGEGLSELMQVAQRHWWRSATFRSIAIPLVGAEVRLPGDGVRSLPGCRRIASDPGPDQGRPPAARPPPCPTVRVRLAGPRVFPVDHLYSFPRGSGGCPPLVGFHVDRIVHAGRPSSGLAA